VPTSTIAISPDGHGGWQVIAAYPAARVCSTRPQQPNPTAVEGIDAGVREVFTDTSGRRYCAGQYERIAVRAERDRARGKARNKLRAVRATTQPPALLQRRRAGSNGTIWAARN
jgi:hypothetical protein